MVIIMVQILLIHTKDLIIFLLLTRVLCDEIMVFYKLMIGDLIVILFPILSMVMGKFLMLHDLHVVRWVALVGILFSLLPICTVIICGISIIFVDNCLLS